MKHVFEWYRHPNVDGFYTRRNSSQEIIAVVYKDTFQSIYDDLPATGEIKAKIFDNISSALVPSHSLNFKTIEEAKKYVDFVLKELGYRFIPNKCNVLK